MGTIIGLIVTGFYVYCCCKIAVRFRRNAIWGFLLIVPIIGNLVYWIVMSITEVKQPKSEEIKDVQ